ncbi:SDR family oxidoreductase [Rhizobium sp. L1K21]|uniref:SDR family oxidoreductase n=1 Tax=Rhizobium sp. L1K21 TaxID=2954933 RepID=UPI0020920F0A|nr:SDR family oxidoreductase [Rhizobium sp. L1K21]MCO6187233.1 SDR family oxidoreductase [Rhizobium sp. L1K21]
MSKLLVTGASGKLGKSAVTLLLANGVAPGDIIATTRDPSKLADLAAKGVDVRAADFDDPASLSAAFAGAERLALISTDALDVPGKRLKQHQAAVNAAKAAGVKHIVYTSMPNPGPESRITFAPDHRGTEEAIKASGLTYTILRNSWYNENLFMSLPSALQSGKWFTSTNGGRLAYIAHVDCAAALAAALASDNTSSEVLTMTGPQSLSYAEIAALASEATGKPIEVINLTDDQLAEGMKAAGVPEFMLPFMLGIEANVREGHFDLVTDDFEKLTGKKPSPLKDFLVANKDALLAAPAGGGH